MLNKIFYKEWIKLRKVIIALVILTLLINAYMFFSLKQSIQLHGAFKTWLQYLYWDVHLFTVLKFSPLFMGVTIGISQFFPEIRNNRLKLTLHIPLPISKIITHHLLSGFVLLSGINIICLLLYFITYNLYFDKLIITILRNHITPWFLAGYIAYFTSSSIVINRSWVNKISLLIIGLIIVIEFITTYSQSMLMEQKLFYISLTMLVAVLPYYSILYFKAGSN